MRRGRVERISCRGNEDPGVTLTWMSLPGFLILVCVLVTVHEFGHYWVARRLGFKVVRFSVGFGRAIWTRVAGRDQTEYVLAAVPLGGYVKLLDERDGPVPADELARSFTHRPHWQRITVLLAGPAFNFLFAILLLTGMLLVSGSTEFQPRRHAPASRAEMKSWPSTVTRSVRSARSGSVFWTASPVEKRCPSPCAMPAGRSGAPNSILPRPPSGAPCPTPPSRWKASACSFGMCRYPRCSAP